jgi:hypothetical protein
MKRLELESRIELRASSGGKLPSKFSGLAYSGKAVHRGSCVIDLATATVTPRMGLLDSHNKGTEAVLGVVESARVESGQLIVSGVLYSDMPGSRAEQIALLAARGYEFQMSVGVYDFNEELVPAGRPVTVNGQSFTGPICVLRSGVIRECSIVTLGADGDTSAAFFSQPGNPDMTKNPTGSGRAQAINKLFADLGEVIGPTERRAYELMEDGAFRLLSAKLRQLAGRFGSEREMFAARVAAADSTAAVKLDSRSVYAKRAAQAAGKLH